MIDVRAFHDLDAVAADAQGALDRAAQPSPFGRLDWYRLTLAHCPPPGKPLVLRADAGGARAWLFLSVSGQRAVPLASWYSLRFGFVRQPGHAPAGEAMTCIARDLRRRRLAQVTLAPMTQAEAEACAAAFRSAGWGVGLGVQTINRRVRTGEWRDYWAARPSRLRDTVRRKGRGDPFRLTVLDRFEAAAWADYETVYARSWKPAEGAPAFLRTLAEREGAAGTLRLGLAYDGARPVAAQLWLVEGGVATIHKLAHDERDKARSPGTLLSHAMFRHAIERDRVDWIDFGTGDDAYKADWTEEAVPLLRLNAWNPATVAGLAGWARHAAGTLVRRLRSR